MAEVRIFNCLHVFFNFFEFHWISVKKITLHVRIVNFYSQNIKIFGEPTASKASTNTETSETCFNEWKPKDDSNKDVSTALSCVKFLFAVAVQPTNGSKVNPLHASPQKTLPRDKNIFKTFFVYCRSAIVYVPTGCL